MTRAIVLSRLVAAAALLFAMSASASAPVLASGRLTVWATNDTVKILETAGPQKLSVVRISAARNEYVSFQVIVNAVGGELRAVTPSATRLLGPRHSSIGVSNFHLYREAYQRVSKPSDAAGHPGEWPDGLIPIGRDPIVGEKRNGAPFDVPSGLSQALWIDLHIPLHQRAGTYHGAIRITSASRAARSVAITLTVWNFAIPSQSSLPTAFGFDTWAAYQEHYGTQWDTNKIVGLTNRYSEAALQMRIAMYGIEAASPDYTFDQATQTISPLDWSLFDRTEVPAFDGRLDSTHRRFSAGSIPQPNNLSDPTHNRDAEDVAYWSAVAKQYRQRGWMNRAYFYYDDEPSSPQDYATAELHARLLRRADPNFKYLLTSAYRPELAGKVNIWVPIINELDSPGFPPPAIYKSRQRAGDKVWWYDSDSSADRGQWPDMFIDHSAMNQRILGWMTWRYGLDGFLYYDTVYSFSARSNPWRNVYFFGANGDGTLFYPGKPSIIGGRTDIPCFSVRLMLVRQSLQDYEYLRLLRARGHGGDADKAVRTLVTSSDSFSKNASKLLQARQNIGREISRLASGSTARPSAVIATQSGA